MYFRCIVITCYLLLEKGGVALHLNKLESPSSKNTLCMPSLVEIGTVVLVKKMKM